MQWHPWFCSHRVAPSHTAFSFNNRIFWRFINHHQSHWSINPLFMGKKNTSLVITILSKVRCSARWGDHHQPLNSLWPGQPKSNLKAIVGGLSSNMTPTACKQINQHIVQIQHTKTNVHTHTGKDSWQHRWFTYHQKGHKLSSSNQIRVHQAVMLGLSMA